MRIAVIGARGFIGQHVVSKTIRLGHEPVEIDKHNKDDLRRNCPGCDVIIHLSSPMGFVGGAEYWSDGTDSLQDAIDFAFESNARFVLASSQAVYDKGGLCCNEQYTSDNWGESDTYYGMKQEQELRLEQSGLSSWTALRYSIVVGSGQRWHSPYNGIVRNICRALYYREPIYIMQDGLQLRDYVSVRDVARATVEAAIAPEGYGVVNVGGPQPYTVLEVLQTCCTYMSLEPVEVKTGFQRPMDPRILTSDMSRFERLFGWRPGGDKLYLTGMICEYINYALKHPEEAFGKREDIPEPPKERWVAPHDDPITAVVNGAFSAFRRTAQPLRSQ